MIGLIGMLGVLQQYLCCQYLRTISHWNTGTPEPYNNMTPEPYNNMTLEHLNNTCVNVPKEGKEENKKRRKEEKTRGGKRNRPQLGAGVGH